VRCQFDLLSDIWGPVPWKQIGEVFFAQFIFRHSAKDIFQPGPFVYATGFASSKQGVHHGRSLGGIVIAAEQVVLATLCWQCNYVGIVGYYLAL
jgi:hypothetical protein